MLLSYTKFTVGGAIVKWVVEIGGEAGGFARDGINWVDGNACLQVREGIGCVVGVGEKFVTGDLRAAMIELVGINLVAKAPCSAFGRGLSAIPMNLAAGRS